MSIRGTIHIENEKIFIRYETRLDSEPVKRILYWQVRQITRHGTPRFSDVAIQFEIKESSK